MLELLWSDGLDVSIVAIDGVVVEVAIPDGLNDETCRTDGLNEATVVGDNDGRRLGTLLGLDDDIKVGG